MRRCSQTAAGLRGQRLPLQRCLSSAQPQVLSFNNTETVFRDRSTPSLVKSLVVFKLCTVQPLVKNAKPLLDLSNKLLGRTLTSAVIKHSFFSQFCAGEDSEDIKPSLARLRKAGIGAILDYAAEADVAPGAQAAAPPPPSAGGAAAAGATLTAGIGGSSSGNSTPAGHARPGHVAGSAADAAAEAEADLDGHLALTITGVRDAGAEAAAGSSSGGRQRTPAETAAAATAGFGFAAVKLTSLARPELLQRVSTMLHEHRRAWRRFNVAAPPVPNPYLGLSVSRDAFVRALRGPSLSQEDAGDLFTAMDYAAGSSSAGDSTSSGSSTSGLDYLEWSDFCALLSIGGVDAHAAAAYAVRGGTPGSLLSVLAPAGGAASLLTEAEQAQWRRVLRRAHELGAAAAAHGVTIMVDAEQTYLQPSIDFLVTTMQRQFNRPLLPQSQQGVAGGGNGPVWVPPESAHVLHRAGASLAALTQSREAGVGAVAAAAAAAGSPPLSALPVGAAGPGVRPSDAASLTRPSWPYCDARLIAQRNGRTGRAVQSAAATAAAAELRSSSGADSSSTSAAGSAVPFVYNTFQAYLTDTPSRLGLALRRSEREGWLFGAKLVRGAYMVQERALAKEKGYKDPIHPNVEATHACYHACADAVLDAAAGKGAEVMIASHNEGSVRYVAQRMGQLGLGPQDGGVSFGQLLGMCDHVSYTLGAHGYRVYKYVPYGPVQDVVPYLLRRAQENSDVLGSAGREIGNLSRELRRRVGMSSSGR